IAIGFLFVALFYKTKSLWTPIIAHAVINSLSAFAVDITNTQQIIVSAVISVIAVIYGMFILKNRGKVYE
ncbi:MAG: CPBP family intramembrane metalloprotease, partial [Clostridia bacterium]|nr:CPBP family intramembrane metalloprotease [Clostridia bacterium]